MSTLVDPSSHTLEGGCPSRASACPTADTISQLAASSVLLLEWEDVCRHIEGCPSCWNEYRAKLGHRYPNYVPGFVLVEELGRGAASVVYAAWREQAPRRLSALKVLNLPSEEQRVRFRREVAIHQSLDSPNIVRCLDHGECGAVTYYEMELVRGDTLDRHVMRKRLTLAEKVALMQRVADAIAFAHERGVSHRDLKPANILINSRGEVRIVDFGLGALRSEDWSVHVRRTHTRVGDVFGTVRYMSPEQAWGGLIGGPIDHQTDVWALGILLYELATNGEYPYLLAPLDQRSGDEALMHRIRNDLPRPPRIPDEQMGPRLSRLIERCLVWDKEFRLESARVLAEELQRCLSGQPLQSHRVPIRYRIRRILNAVVLKHRPAVSLLSVVASLIIVSAIAFAANSRWGGEKQAVLETNRPAEVRAIPALTPEDVVIVGISNDSVATVPELAEQLGYTGLTKELSTWRAVHGHQMRQLAKSTPLAVAWDFHMEPPRPEDPAFCAGVLELDRKGVPVTIAAKDFTTEGEPKISPGIMECAGRQLNFGSILVRNPLIRPGEFVLASRRNGKALPSFGLSVVAGLRNPDRRIQLEWPEGTNEITVLYQDRDQADSVLPARDRLTFMHSYEHKLASAVVQRGDVIGCRVFELRHPSLWEQRVIAYEWLLTAEEADIRSCCSDKVVVFGDLRRGLGFDRHRALIGTEVIPDVPGCFFMADSIVGMTSQPFFKRLFPLSGWTLVAAVMTAYIGVLLPGSGPLSRRMLHTALRRGLVGALVGGFILGAGMMTVCRDQTTVHFGLAVATFSFAAIFGTRAEYIRRRHSVDSDYLRRW